LGPISVLLAIALIAAVEYLSASLLDSTEIDRHMFLFHTFTDLTFILAAATEISWSESYWRGRTLEKKSRTPAGEA
jgi:hypothetical protein